MSDARDYFTRLAAAFVRGSLHDDVKPVAYRSLFSEPLDALNADEQALLIELGVEQRLRLHRFKRTMGLPRVQRVLGILKGLQPSSLLDLGSGRGAFLWPLLDTFPTLPVTALDRLDYRVRALEAVRDGGVMSLRPVPGDVTMLPFNDKDFDVVTMLEVLEHVPEYERALTEACRVTRRFLVLSVPSQPDNNPEHIHLFDARTLTALLQAQGITRLSVDYVPNHIIIVARIRDSA